MEGGKTGSGLEHNSLLCDMQQTQELHSPGGQHMPQHTHLSPEVKLGFSLKGDYEFAAFHS